MPAVTRKGDSCTGHGCYPPRPSTSGSGDVLVNGKSAVRQGDSFAVHGCPKKDPPPPHGGSLGGGSSTVFANGKPLGRIGDAVDCGSAVAAGSSNVFAGG